MVDLGDAIVLGAVQGLTEFLPISSDGHLAIGAALLEVHEPSLAMVVLLHLGTLVATLWVLRRDVVDLLTGIVDAFRTEARPLASPAVEEAGAILVASVPTAVIGLLLHDFVEPWARDLRIVAVCLLVSAFFVGSTYGNRSGEGTVLDWKRAALVGVVQGLAVLPGWSRSGSTIAMAMMLGLSGPAAFRFSFLLSLPAVGGACLLELTKDGVLGGMGVEPFVGALVAFGAGYLALRLLRGVVSQGRFHVFAYYLVPLAAALFLVAARH